MNKPPDIPVPVELDAEESLLSACLFPASTAIEDVATWLHARDFYRERNAWVYEALVALHDRQEGIDNITVAAELKRAGRLDEVGGPAFLAGLLALDVTPMHAPYYASLVSRAAQRRRIIQAGSLIAQAGHDDKLDEAVLRDRVDAILTDALSGASSEQDFTPLIEVIDRLDNERWHEEARPAPIKTGLGALDAAMGGLHRGDMTVIAGAPGHGKTSLINSVVRAVAGDGQVVAYFSLEMKDERVGQRLLRMETAIPFHRLQLPATALRPDERDDITRANGVLSGLPLYIADKRGQTIEDIKRRARRLARRQDIGLLVVDYAQLVYTARNFKSRADELDYIAYELYAMAENLDCHVLVAAQLVKEDFTNAPPTLDKVKGAGGLIAAPNNVLFVWRDESATSRDPVMLTRLHIGKQREGDTKPVDVGWYGAKSAFVDLAELRAVNAAARGMAA